MKKKLPIGIEDFKEIIEKDCYYVDKTLFIKELLDNSSKVRLFTRPRRFGKTLALSMLRYYFEKEYDRIFTGFGFQKEDKKKKIKQFSGGEQTKLALIKLLLSKPDILLLDEPTNHLDIRARRQLADYLKRKKGYLLVSHDRYLLDECTDHILSLNRTDIEVQSGNFSSWMENFERQQKFERNQNERLRKDIRRLKESARQSEGWSKHVEAS